MIGVMAPPSVSTASSNPAKNWVSDIPKLFAILL